MNKIYILGGNGYIGSHFRKYFSGKDELISINYKSKKNGISIKNFLSSSFKINENDKIFDCSWYKPTDYENKYHLTISMIQKMNEYNALIKKGARKFYVCGSCLEYGQQDGQMTNQSLLLPVVPYAIAKVYLFYYLQNYIKKVGGLFSWFRLFYIYGGERRVNSLYSEALKNSDKKKMITGDLSRRRDFIHIEECCNQMQKKINGDNFGVYIICNGKSIRIDKFIAMVTHTNIEDWDLTEEKQYNLWFEPHNFFGEK